MAKQSKAQAAQAIQSAIADHCNLIGSMMGDYFAVNEHMKAELASGVEQELRTMHKAWPKVDWKVMLKGSTKNVINEVYEAFVMGMQVVREENKLALLSHSSVATYMSRIRKFMDNACNIDLDLFGNASREKAQAEKAKIMEKIKADKADRKAKKLPAVDYDYKTGEPIIVKKLDSESKNLADAAPVSTVRAVVDDSGAVFTMEGYDGLFGFLQDWIDTNKANAKPVCLERATQLLNALAEVATSRSEVRPAGKAIPTTPIVEKVSADEEQDADVAAAEAVIAMVAQKQAQRKLQRKAKGLKPRTAK